MTETPSAHPQIIARYRRIASLPDGLFFFTFPLRRRAVDRLGLAPGGLVLEIGCGSGANLDYLVRAIGPSGLVVGVDLSPDMIAAAQVRVQRHGWSNVRLVESAAENLQLSERFDALLLFAMHDVLTSAAAIERSLAHLKPGGRVVAVSPVLAEHPPGRLLNPAVAAVFRRFSVAQTDRECPWRLLAESLPGLQVERLDPGILFLASGQKT
jgi:ubiquinone/menaquinone biosynthesis C-methylase UbiE